MDASEQVHRCQVRVANIVNWQASRIATLEAELREARGELKRQRGVAGAGSSPVAGAASQGERASATRNPPAPLVQQAAEQVLRDNLKVSDVQDLTSAPAEQSGEQMDVELDRPDKSRGFVPWWTSGGSVRVTCASSYRNAACTAWHAAKDECATELAAAQERVRELETTNENLTTAQQVNLERVQELAEELHRTQEDVTRLKSQLQERGELIDRLESRAALVPLPDGDFYRRIDNPEPLLAAPDDFWAGKTLFRRVPAASFGVPGEGDDSLRRIISGPTWSLKRLKLCIETLKGYNVIGADGQGALQVLGDFVAAIEAEAQQGDGK